MVYSKQVRHNFLYRRKKYTTRYFRGVGVIDKRTITISKPLKSNLKLSKPTVAMLIKCDKALPAAL
jgi:hypothetical protein